MAKKAYKGRDPFGRYHIGPDGCWHWIGEKNIHGYGRHCTFVGRQRSRQLAHRMFYERFHGPIPKGMVVMHTCDVKDCVNPDHLSLGTQAENLADMTAKGRRRNQHSTP